MCDQQRLRPACAYAQSDQSLCWSIEYSMSAKLLTEHHLMVLSLKEGCTGSIESHMSKCHIVGNHMSRLKCIKPQNQEGHVDRDKESTLCHITTVMRGRGGIKTAVYLNYKNQIDIPIIISWKCSAPRY